MSFWQDFDHDIPPDDWEGHSSWRRKSSFRQSSCRSYSNYVDYNSSAKLEFEDIVIETEKAYLFKLKQGNTWIPKSKVMNLSMNKLCVSIPLWLYRSLNIMRDTPKGPPV